MSARTENRRVWLGGGAVAAVGILLVGWFLVIHPQLSTAAANRDQAAGARLQNVGLAAKNDKLRQQNDNAATLRDDLAAALAELPSDGGLPAFTRQLSAQATANSVVLTSIVVGGVEPVADAVAAVAPGTDTGTATATAPSSGASAPTGATAASSGALVEIPINLVATGLGKNEMAFLEAIQVTGPRRALVSASQLSPSGGSAAGGIDGPCTLTLSLTIFSAPLSPTAQAALQKLLSGK